MLSAAFDSLFKRKYQLKESRVYPAYLDKSSSSPSSPSEYSLSSTDCSLEELLALLGDVHMTVSAPPAESINLTDPTTVVNFSIIIKHHIKQSPHKTQKKVPTLISVLLTGIAGDGAGPVVLPGEENNQAPSSTAAGINRFSPGKVITAIRDLVIFLGSVPSGYEITSYNDMLSQDSALATMNITFDFLILWDQDFSKPLPFYEELIAILVELCHRLERIGSMIDHASSDILKAVWNKAVAQTMQYVRNIAVYITQQKIHAFDTIRCARSVSGVVNMIATLAGCVAVTREW